MSTARPDFSALEQRITTELRAAVATMIDAHADEPIAAIVLWADPYKGWYEVHFDTEARNAAGARERNAKMLELLPTLSEEDDAWKTAQSTGLRIQALPFDPRYGEYSSCDEPVHEFEVSFSDFVRSPAYAELNAGGEDGWLEGHVRFVLSRAIAGLAAEGAFSALPRAANLYVGYAYPDSGDAIVVAIVGG